MIASLWLGIRLAGAGAAARSGRGRSAMVALAAAVGAVLLLAVLAIAHSEGTRPSAAVAADDQGLRLLLATVVLVVALPVVVLASAAGRLSAALRDRRLANLRLLGMTTAQTRLVAAVETGIAAAVGAILGLVVFFPVRAVLGVWHPADRPWSYATLTPGGVAYVVIVIAVPLVVTLVSASARGGRAHSGLAQSRRSDTRRPGWWRLVPLAAGIGLGAYLVGAQNAEYEADLIPWMFAAIALLGIGVILVVPSLVRLVADLLVRFRGRPTLVIAGRRLQSQPAAATRVVAGLLIGLFIVTGARMVVVAFEQTPQYREAAMIDTTGQMGTAFVEPGQASETVAQFDAVDGIRAVAAFSALRQVCPGDGIGRGCIGVDALVGTCVDLSRILGALPDCRDDEPAWIGDQASVPGEGPWRFAPAPGAGQVSTDRGANDMPSATVTVPGPTTVLGDPERIAPSLTGHLFLPKSLPGVAAVASSAMVSVIAIAEPGIPIMPLLAQVNAPGGFSGVPGMEAYDYAASLRMLVWAIAAVVLAVGLLGFAIGAVDRAISRRSEVVSLQLVGTGAPMLRRTQWIEAALPLTAGIVLAIAAGSLAGASYLAYGGEARFLPWGEIGLLTGISLAAAVVVAGITVIASSPRIRPELIRTE